MAFLDKRKKKHTVPGSFSTDSNVSGPTPPVPESNWFEMPPPHNRKYIEGLGLVELPQPYPLVFCLMENNVCTRKIEYTFTGSDNPDSILSKLLQEGLLPQRPGFSYRILYWPTQNGRSTVDHLDDSEPKYISQFNPYPGTMFIIQQYPIRIDPISYTLYGCPTAAIPGRRAAPDHMYADMISFD